MDDNTVMRKTRIGNGFVKEDVEAYFKKLKEQIQNLQYKLKDVASADYYDEFMKKFDFGGVLDDNYLKNNVRVKRLGGGYNKEDVMMCLDQINAVILIFTEKIESYTKPRNNSFLS